jgi:hypothetical protein
MFLQSVREYEVASFIFVQRLVMGQIRFQGHSTGLTQSLGQPYKKTPLNNFEKK